MNTEPTGEPETHSKRARSPAYPFIGLEESTVKAKIIWEKAQRHEVAVIPTLAELWNVSQTSSSAPAAVSAMKRFGLLEEVDRQGARHVRLTELALEIINHPSGSEEQSQAIKKAALLPGIYARLWQKYTGQIPADSVLKSYLLLQEKFNAASVDRFLSAFRSTLLFANLTKDDTLPLNFESDSDAIATNEQAITTLVPATSGQATPPQAKPVELVRFPRKVDAAPPGTSQWILPVEGRYIRVEAPEGMSKAVWEKLNAYVQILKPTE